MVSYFVSHRGPGPGPVGFIERYADAHAPDAHARVLAAFAGVCSLVLHLSAEACARARGLPQLPALREQPDAPSDGSAQGIGMT